MFSPCCCPGSYGYGRSRHPGQSFLDRESDILNRFFNFRNRVSHLEVRVVEPPSQLRHVLIRWVQALFSHDREEEQEQEKKERRKDMANQCKPISASPTGS